MAPKAKGSLISVDFTGVSSSGGAPIPPGDYAVKVMDVSNEISASKGNPYLKWELEVISPECKGRKLWHNTVLTPAALWNLRKTLEALGMEIPDSSYDLNIRELINGVMGVTVEHEEYQGKMKAKVADVFALEDEVDEDDEEEVAPPPPPTPPAAKKSKKAAPPPPPVEEDEDDEDDEDEDEEEVAPPPPPAKKAKKAAAPPPPVEEDEDDEEEAEPAPAPKRGKKK